MKLFSYILQQFVKYLDPRTFRGDKWIWGIVILLAIISIAAVYTSTFMLAYSIKGGNTEYYMIRQSIFCFLAFAIMIVLQKMPISSLTKFNLTPYLVYLSVIVSFLLLVVTAKYSGEVNGANRWLSIAGISVQSSDVAKLTLVIYLTYFISTRQNSIKTRKSFLYLFIPTVMFCGVIFFDDLSTAVLLSFVAFLIMFIGGVATKYLVGLMALGCLAIVSLFSYLIYAPSEMLFGRFGTWKNRILQFTDADNISFQAQEATNAILNGGFRGAGIGAGIHKNHLPHPYSDYIYATIIEESGLLFGGLLVPFLFIALLFRTALIFKNSKNLFSGLLAIGLGISIVSQAFVHMIVNVGIGPVTGITLPFVSYGGTSLLLTGLSFGLILSASNKEVRQVKQIRIKRKNINPRIAVS